jgi:hypothetical protein
MGEKERPCHLCNSPEFNWTNLHHKNIEYNNATDFTYIQILTLSYKDIDRLYKRCAKARCHQSNDAYYRDIRVSEIGR